MSTTAGEIITKAQELCSDSDGVRYLTSEGVGWVNDGQRAISTMRPDLFVEHNTFQLAMGAKQTVPAGYTALNGIVSNMGTDGVTPGEGVTGPVSRELMDAFGGWRTANQKDYVLQYMYGDDTDETFWVYPPNTGSGYIEAELVRVPVDCADENATIDMDDVYSPVLIEWVVFRFWERDSEETPNWQRAARSLQNVLNALTLDEAKGMQISAKIAEFMK